MANEHELDSETDQDLGSQDLGVTNQTDGLGVGAQIHLMSEEPPAVSE